MATNDYFQIIANYCSFEAPSDKRCQLLIYFCSGPSTGLQETLEYQQNNFSLQFCSATIIQFGSNGTLGGCHIENLFFICKEFCLRLRQIALYMKKICMTTTKFIIVAKLEDCPIKKCRLKLFCWHSRTQWSKWPKFVSLYYWRTPRGARGVKKSGWPNWIPLWWVGAIRFSQNWRNCEKPSKLNKNCQRNPVFKSFFEFYSIWAES